MKDLLMLLDKYPNNGCFVFKAYDDLCAVCNAPSYCAGIYAVFQSRNNEILFIGRSGKNENGRIVIRKAGLGGIKDRIVNGHQFGKIPRKKSWPKKMRESKIDEIKIYWWDTENDNPDEIKKELLESYKMHCGRLPLWHKK